MSDTTVVYLTVLTVHEEEVESFFRYAPDEQSCRADKTRYEFTEINYGELDFLDKLETSGIAYDSEWSSGAEYTEGCRSCRYTSEGEAIDKTVYANDDAVPLSSLRAVIDDHAAMVKLIEMCEQHIEVLPWDNQKQYGDIYKLKKLVGL